MTDLINAQFMTTIVDNKRPPNFGGFSICIRN